MVFILLQIFLWNKTDSFLNWNVNVVFVLAFWRLQGMEFFLSLCPLHWPRAWSPGLEWLFFFLIKNIIFHELSHTLSELRINAAVTPTILELLRNWRCYPASVVVLPTAFTSARNHSSSKMTGTWESHPKAGWVILISHAGLLPWPILPDHRWWPLGSEESWNSRYNWQRLKSLTVGMYSQRDSEFSVINIASCKEMDFMALGTNRSNVN